MLVQFLVNFTVCPLTSIKKNFFLKILQFRENLIGFCFLYGFIRFLNLVFAVSYFALCKLMSVYGTIYGGEHKAKVVQEKKLWKGKSICYKIAFPTAEFLLRQNGD